MSPDTLVSEEVQRRMLMRETIVAETIARFAHYHQRIRSTGEAFIMHPAAVAESLPHRYRPAGWLHDILEDTDVSPGQLLYFGISPETITIVSLVSRLDPMKETYAEFIHRIAESGNKGAMVVKLADLRHNCRPGCPADLLHRYKLAIPILEAALATV
jgi:(p)ppGpp synthase/HD superfamily hydrolase